MSSRQQSDNTRRLRLVANNIRESWPDEEEITLTQIPTNAPGPARAGIGVLLTVPPPHRAYLIALALVLVAAVIIWGALPSWLR